MTKNPQKHMMVTVSDCVDSKMDQYFWYLYFEHIESLSFNKFTLHRSSWLEAS